MIDKITARKNRMKHLNEGLLTSLEMMRCNIEKVEVRGVEPRSLSYPITASTRVVYFLNLALILLNKQT